MDKIALPVVSDILNHHDIETQFISNNVGIYTFIDTYFINIVKDVKFRAIIYRINKGMGYEITLDIKHDDVYVLSVIVSHVLNGSKSCGYCVIQNNSEYVPFNK